MTFQIGTPSSTLTQVIERREPAGTGGQTAIRKNSLKQNEILTTGKDGLLHYIARDPNSDTGWSTHPQSNEHQYNQLFVPEGSNQLYGVVVGTTLSDLTQIYPLDIDEQTKTVTAKDAISAKADGDFEVAANITVASGDYAGNWDVFIQLINSGKTRLLFYVFVDPTTGTGKPYYESNGDATNLTGPIIAATNGFSENIGTIQAFGCEQGSISAEVRNAMNKDCQVIMSNGQPIKMSGACIVSNPASGQNPTHAYLTDWAGAIYEVTSKEITPGNSQYITWENEATLIPITGLQLEEGVPPKLAGISDKRGVIHLFAWSSAYVLWHTRQTPDGGWTDWTPIGSKIASCRPQLNADHDIELFCISSETSQKMHTLKYVDSDSPEWIEEEVDISAIANAQATGHLTPATLVSIPVIDADGVAVANQALSLTSTFNVDAMANGESITLDPNTPCAVETSEDGTLSLALPFHNADGLPTITVKAPDGSIAPITVDPREPITTGVCQLTGTEITDYNAANPTETITPSSWTASQNSSFADQLADMFKSVNSGADALTSNLTTQSHPGISIRLDGLSPTLTDLSGGDFETLKQTAIDNEKRLAATLLAAGLGDGNALDWGSVWKGITQGIVKVSEVVFQTAETVWHIIIDGTATPFYFPPKTLDDAFNMLGSIFVSLAIDVANFVNWLLDQFGIRTLPSEIEAWSAFIKSSMKDGFAGLTSNLKKPSTLKPQADSFLQEIGTQIDSLLNPILAQPGVTETMEAFAKANEVIDHLDIFAPGSVGADIMKSLMGQINQASSDFQGLDTAMEKTLGAMSQPLLNSLSGTTNQANTAGQVFSAQFQNSSGRSAAQQYKVADTFNTLKSNPDLVSQLLSSVSSGFFETADLMYDGLASLPETMDTPLEIPFLTDMYKLLTGATTAPSFLDILVVSAALPLAMALPGQAPGNNFALTADTGNDDKNPEKFIVLALALLKHFTAYFTGKTAIVRGPNGTPPPADQPKTILRALTAGFGVIGSSIAISIATAKGSNQTIHGLFVYGLLDLLTSFVDLCTSWVYELQVTKINLTINVPQVLSILEAIGVISLLIYVVATGYLKIPEAKDLLVIVIDILLAVLLTMRALPDLRKAWNNQELFFRTISTLLLGGLLYIPEKDEVVEPAAT